MASLNLKTECKNLFFDKYIYRARFTTPGARWLTQSRDIDDFRDAAQSHRDFMTKWYNTSQMWILSPRGKLDAVSPKDETPLEKMYDFDKTSLLLEWVNYYKYMFKFRSEQDVMCVYSNDLNKLSSILDIEPKTKFVKRVAIGDKYTLWFSNEPSYKYRVFINTGNSRSKNYQNLEEFVHSHKNNSNYNISPAVLRAFVDPSRVTNRSTIIYGKYFIEFNEESAYSYLGILFDGKISPLYTCKKQP